jgi:hypothetical protein
MIDEAELRLSEVKRLVKLLGESGFGTLGCLATVDAFEAVAHGELDADDVDLDALCDDD